MHYIWTEMFILFLVIFISKFLAKQTNTVDVLWYIVLGAILGNTHLVIEDERVDF